MVEVLLGQGADINVTDKVSMRVDRKQAEDLLLQAVDSKVNRRTPSGALTGCYLTRLPRLRTILRTEKLIQS